MRKILAEAEREGLGDFEIVVDVNRYEYVNEVYISDAKRTVCENTNELIFYIPF